MYMFFLFKQKTAYEMRISDWSSDVCSSDLDMARMTDADFATMVEEGSAATSMFEFRDSAGRIVGVMLTDRLEDGFSAVYSYYDQIGRASCRGRVWKSV